MFLKRTVKHSKAATQKKTKLVLKTDYRLIQLESIAECSKWHFRPAFSNNLS